MLKDEVYRSIKLRIITQELPPGATVNDKEFIETYNLGKTPLREVFFRLENDGLLRRFPRVGTIVAPIDFQELREAAEIRLVLENLVGELAVRHITPDLLEDMRTRADCLERTVREDQLNQYVVAEMEMHEILYRAANNRRLARTISEQQHLFARMWFSVKREHRDRLNQVEDWRKIYQALVDRDEARLVELNRGHFETFYQYLKARL